jgi:hypothetical protein
MSVRFFPPLNKLQKSQSDVVDFEPNESNRDCSKTQNTFQENGLMAAAEPKLSSNGSSNQPPIFFKFFKGFVKFVNFT